MKNKYRRFLRKIKHMLTTPSRMYKKADSLKRKKEICRLKCHMNGDKIKIGFIVQVPEIWDKEAPVYEAMLLDIRFEPFLLLVPAYDMTKSEIRAYGEEADFFIKKYGINRVIKLYSTEWVDLEEYKFDYIFYQRCYENYLPSIYHTKKIINYAKTCYIPYGIAGLRQDDYYYETDFFLYLYKFFCSSADAEAYFKSKKAENVVFCGVPAMEGLINQTMGDYDKVVANRILWTPRWTDDEYYGGTTFFSYMHKVLELPCIFKSMEVILRPHPLTFEYAISQKKMTEDDVKEYKHLVAQRGVRFDSNSLIEDTFKSIDILLTDYSSMILQFYMTGKPIIYCSKKDVDFDEVYLSLVETFYIAENWDDVVNHIKNLREGKDPLKEKRLKIIGRLKKDNKDATTNILNHIYQDAHNIQ